MSRRCCTILGLGVSIALVTTSCGGDKALTCDDVPVTENCLDRVDANADCTSNAQCSGMTPVCDLDASKTCVECTVADATACSGITPACGANNASRGELPHLRMTR